MLFRTRSLWMSLGLLSIVLLSLPLYAADDKSKAKSNDSISSAVQTKVDGKISKKQKEIINEAVNALKETKKALTALEKDKAQNALKHLEKAVGELEVALARDPDLALAAIDTRITIHD
jgi:predicted negative regulator of RcsB-dependent stress response